MGIYPSEGQKRMYHLTLMSSSSIISEYQWSNPLNEIPSESPSI